MCIKYVTQLGTIVSGVPHHNRTRGWELYACHDHLQVQRLTESQIYIFFDRKYKEREEVWRKAGMLTGSGLQLSEDVTRRARDSRAELRKFSRLDNGHEDEYYIPDVDAMTDDR